MRIHSSVVLVFALLGLIDTLYLSYHAIKKTDVACWFFPKEWCQRVQYSHFSRTFGVPNPYLGLIMYLVILGLLLFAPGLWLLPAIIIFGFAFSLYFTFIQAFVLRAFCTWCVVSALNFTIMFVSLFA